LKTIDPKKNKKNKN